MRDGTTCSNRSDRIALLLSGRDLDSPLDPHYAAFLECFNQGQYYQAHEVLEALWLKCRKSIQGDFFKGLIQVAGAFVHVQKGRVNPASALLELAGRNLQKYSPVFDRLDVASLLALIRSWQSRLTQGSGETAPWPQESRPKLLLTKD